MRESDFIKNYYEIDFGLTLFFNQIYGQEEYYKFKEYATLSDYKKQFCKLFHASVKWHCFRQLCRQLFVRLLKII